MLPSRVCPGRLLPAASAAIVGLEIFEYDGFSPSPPIRYGEFWRDSATQRRPLVPNRLLHSGSFLLLDEARTRRLAGCFRRRDQITYRLVECANRELAARERTTLVSVDCRQLPGEIRDNQRKLLRSLGRFENPQQVFGRIFDFCKYLSRRMRAVVRLWASFAE